MDNATQQAWQKVDEGLYQLMLKNDDLSDAELTAKYRRLQHLEKFVKRLGARVSERLMEHTKPGPVQPLFDQYREDRNQIDFNV